MKVYLILLSIFLLPHVVFAEIDLDGLAKKYSQEPYNNRIQVREARLTESSKGLEVEILAQVDFRDSETRWTLWPKISARSSVKELLVRTCETLGLKAKKPKAKLLVDSEKGTALVSGQYMSFGGKMYGMWEAPAVHGHTLCL